MRPALPGQLKTCIRSPCKGPHVFCILPISTANYFLFTFREPNVNLGIGPSFGKLPHVVGKKLLAHVGLSQNTPEAYAYTYLNFEEAWKEYGRMGGFPHQLKTLLGDLRQQAGGQANTLTMDGGDLWQGSATSLWTRGMDMVEASNILGVDVMVGHWGIHLQGRRGAEQCLRCLKGILSAKTSR